MGRWKPPTQPGSKYITPEGEVRLRGELEQLWRVERPQVTQAGDRSENAEYIYGKRRLREIDSRVRFLRKRLDGMVVVDRPPSDPQRVFFSAWVDLEDEAGDTLWHRVVGPDEFDADPRYVSMDAPLGRALLGKRLDDEITVETPAGRRTWIVASVAYGPTPPN